MHDFLQKRADDLEVLGHDESRPNLLHAEHEDGEECVLHLCVIRVLESMLTDLQYQTLHRLLQILEGKLGQSLILVAEATSWHFLFVLVFHVKHFRLDFEVFEEGIQKVSRVLISDKLIFVSIAPILRYLHWLK